MAPVASVNPKILLGAERFEALNRRSVFRGLFLVVHCWFCIGAAATVFAWVPNALTYLLAVTVIGSRQLGLAILMHDAAHGSLHSRSRLNEFIGEWLCGAPIGASLAEYRRYHLKHHKYAQQAEDPDLSVSQGFPTSKRSLVRKMIRDLSGQTFFSQRIAPSLARLRRRPARAAVETVVVNRGGWHFWAVNGLLFGIASAAGKWWLYPALWLFPLATWFMLVLRIRNIAEHACMPVSDDPFRHARTTLVSVLERVFFAPYWVNFHSEHHLMMSLPCWSLPKAHRQLLEQGFNQHMVFERGYLQVARAVSEPKANG